jgi:hypothetical protein
MDHEELKKLDDSLPKQLSIRKIEDKKIHKKLDDLCLIDFVENEYSCWCFCARERDPSAPLSKSETTKLVNTLMEIKVVGVSEKDIREFIVSYRFLILRQKATGIQLNKKWNYLAPEERHRGFEIINASLFMLDELERKAKTNT